MQCCGTMALRNRQLVCTVQILHTVVSGVEDHKYTVEGISMSQCIVTCSARTRNSSYDRMPRGYAAQTLLVVPLYAVRG